MIKINGPFFFFNYLLSDPQADNLLGEKTK